MSNWQAEQAERNRKSLARLTKALPAIFPPVVLARALSRPFIPRRYGWRSIHIGARIPSALIA